MAGPQITLNRLHSGST